MVEDQRETISQEVEDYALRFLKQGRDKWDVPHTKSVVHYAKEIAQAEGYDILVAVTAAWFHDIGYFSLFNEEDTSTLSNVRDRKALHMENGAKMAKAFFERPEVAEKFTPQQKERIIHLVSVHDKVDELQDLDELILMEADTLGIIDISRVKPTYNRDDWIRFLESVKGRRAPRFLTTLGKKYLKELLPIAESYSDNFSPSTPSTPEVK